MFMERIIYETVYKSIYESGFYKANVLPYDLGMSDLKKTILSEMSKRDWKPTELARVSKVPQPTIQRFLSGTHGEPRSATIKKIAAAFGMTELELRGGYNEHKINNETLNNTLYKAIEQLSVEQQRQVEQFVLFLASQTPAPQQNENKHLTEEIKDVGGGGKSEPVQLQQSQDQRVTQSEFYAMVGAVCDKTNWE